MRTLLRLDRGQNFRFAPLGGRTYRSLGSPGGSGAEAKSLWLYEPGMVPRLSQKGPALLRAASYLPPPLSWLALFQRIPGFSLLLSGFYRVLAHHRRGICAWDPKIAKAIQVKGRMLP